MYKILNKMKSIILLKMTNMKILLCRLFKFFQEQLATTFYNIKLTERAKAIKYRY